MAQDPNPVEIKVTSSADLGAVQQSTEALKDTTAATKELTEAEAERAQRKAEYEARLAEKRANGTNVAVPDGDGPNPMTDGSQLAAAVQMVEVTKAQTEAIKDQAEALDELSDAEAGVIRSTAQLNSEAKKPDGFKQLFDQQRLQGIGQELQKLAGVVGDFAREFAQTEKGKEALSGLSEETQVFGKVFGSVASAVGTGFAAGGPIAAAIAGIGALFKEVGGEWLGAQERIEAANQQMIRSEDELAKKMAERRREARSAEIEKAYKRELDVLEDQNEALREQQGLRDALAERDREAFDLKQAQDKAAGKDPSQLRKDKIAFDRDQEFEKLDREEAELIKARDDAEKRRNDALKRREDLRSTGTDRDEFKKADADFREADEALNDANRDIIPRYRANRTRREGVGIRAKREIFEEEQREKERLAQEEQRREDQARREKERADKDAARASDQEAKDRDRTGREGESLADQAARLSGKNARAAAAFEKLGDGLNDNPTLAAMDRLSDGMEKMGKAVGDQNSIEARRWRELNDKVEKIIAQMKKRGDGK